MTAFQREQKLIIEYILDLLNGKAQSISSQEISYDIPRFNSEMTLT